LYEPGTSNFCYPVSIEQATLKDGKPAIYLRLTVDYKRIQLATHQRYKDQPSCVYNNRLLPVNSNQRFNGYLKEIATICGIKKHLTTHTARHTFATKVTLEHDVPIDTVSQTLGHKSIRTTQMYPKVTQRKVSKNMKDLKNRLFGVGSEFKQEGK
jgi:site-specific recombinase XerD